MKDENLEFWTTPPNCFLVATISGQVVGCISYKKFSSDTAEMHRLAVDLEFHGQKIGQKLVQALLNTAWSNGFDSMYLETTNAQTSAINLYEKMDFKYLRDCSLALFPTNMLDFWSGLHNRAYVRQTNFLSNLSVEDSLSKIRNPLSYGCS